MKSKRKVSLRWSVAALGAALLTVLAVLLLNGCNTGPKSADWSEEVSLLNGDTIIVERSAEGTVLSELGGISGWRIKKNRLGVKSKNSSISIPDWTGSSKPLFLDYDVATKTWVLIATRSTCEAWIELGKPNPPYFEYQSKGGAPWIQVGLEDRLLGLQTNLLIDPAPNDQSKLIGLYEKKLRRENVTTIDLKILKKWGSNEHNYC